MNYNNNNNKNDDDDVDNNSSSSSNNYYSIKSNPQTHSPTDHPTDEEEKMLHCHLRKGKESAEI